MLQPQSPAFHAPFVRVEGEVARREERATPLPPSEESPGGGNLTNFNNRWKFCPWASSVVSKELGWEWIDKPSPLQPFYQEDTPSLREYVEELLSKAVIKKVKCLMFQGRLFCVPNKDSDKERVLLDLSYLNKFIRFEKFRMLTLSQVRTLLPRGAVNFSIDLTDTYWHIPIARRFTPPSLA